MTKKQFTIFLTVMLLIAAGAGIWIFLAFNPPAKIGTLTVSSGGNAVNPFSSVLEYRTDSRKETLRERNLSDIADTLPVLICGDGFVVNPSEDTLDNSFAFSLYNEEGEALYTGRPRYEKPETAGNYIVKIILAWGNKDDNMILTENYFKVTYQ